MVAQRNWGGTLAGGFDPRHNNMTLLRLCLALMVAVAHGQVNGFGWQVHVGGTELAQVAVDGFFVISGLLVARSYLSLDSLARFIWHRALRIMPGFWVCLLVTALVVAPAAGLIAHGAPQRAFTDDPSAFGYVFRNSGLLMQQYDIANLLEGIPSAGVFDGALWTLFYEAACYGVLALVGVAGFLRHRRWLVAAGLLVLWAALAVTAADVVTLPGTTAPLMLRFAFLFSLGATAWLYRERVRLSLLLLVLAFALLAGALLGFEDYRPLGAVALAYILLVASVVRLPWSPRTDLSYGLYVYHWPVQQLLVVGGAAVIGVVPFVALSVVCAAGCAWVSWHLVEAPALRHKNARWVNGLGRRRGPWARQA